ncbi:MAG: methyltransferase [Alphaproteobacteria bacterium]|nr:methyltransferase [Alphaproteobacteria bacterium]
MMETTVDTLLGGRFEVEQPAKGYRIAVDTLLLASAIPAQPGQKVGELGCGVGGVMLALATRLPDVVISGFELQQPMVALCASNIRRNHFEERLSVVEGDIVTLPPEFIGVFDHVMMNPPYHDHKSHSVSANTSKRLAHAESDDADLSVWIKQAAQCLKPGGIMSLIHRGDRLDEIIGIAQLYFGDIVVKPIISKEAAPAKRVIVRASKKEEGGVERLPPFILYGDDGRYSQQAEAILRGAEELPF